MFVPQLFRRVAPSLIRRSISSQHSFCRRFSSNIGHIDANNIVRSPFPDVSIPTTNVYTFIASAFEKYERDTALIDGVQGKEITFGRLQEDIGRASSALREMGFVKGDVLALCSPNCLDYPKLFLAAVAAGGVVSTCNPTYTSEELNFQFKTSGAKFIATIPALVPLVQEAVKGLNIKRIIVIEDNDQASQDENIVSLSTLLENSGSQFRIEPVNSKEDVVVLPFSSGTTGLPKGVMLTHYNIISNCCQLSHPDVAIVKEGEPSMSLLPFFHIYGMVAILFLALRTGARQIVLPKFEPTLFLSSIQKYGITSANLVPPLILFLAKHPEVSNYDVSSLKSIVSGAAPLGGNVVKDAQERCGVSIIRQAYGLTELSPASHCMPISMGMSKPSSIGPVLANILCKIVDPESGKTLGAGEEGEVVISGPNVMKGYLNLPHETSKCIDNEGWFKTGDIGYFDNDGHFYITDRLKELIKVKGLQVAPAELEAGLLKHPDIVDVAVVGVPNDRLGEAPKAYVVRKSTSSLTEDQVKEFVEGRFAAHKWLVGGIEFIEEIPKSASGKILRRLLK